MFALLVRERERLRTQLQSISVIPSLVLGNNLVHSVSTRVLTTRYYQNKTRKFLLSAVLVGTGVHFRIPISNLIIDNALLLPGRPSSSSVRNTIAF